MFLGRRATCSTLVQNGEGRFNQLKGFGASTGACAVAMASRAIWEDYTPLPKPLIYAYVTVVPMYGNKRQSIVKWMQTSYQVLSGDGAGKR